MNRRFAPLIAAFLAMPLGLVAAEPAAGSSRESLAVVSEMIDLIEARFVEPVSKEALVAIALEALGSRDPYSEYLSPEDLRKQRERQRGSYAGVGVRHRPVADGLEVIEAIEGAPAAAAGLRAGDLIVAIDGRPIDPESPSGQLRGPAGTPVRLTVQRPDTAGPLEITIVRDQVVMPVVRGMALDDVGYIRLRSFTRQASPGVFKAVAYMREEIGDRMKGIVLDLRGNHGGLVEESVAIADAFLEGGTILTETARDKRDARQYEARPGDITGGLPLVLLVDGESASASEILTGALQDHGRSVVIGAKTYGKGIVQTTIQLSDGGALKLTTARYFTPSGRSIHGIGIEPDIAVASAPEGSPKWDEAPDADRDPPLAAALDLLRGTGQVRAAARSQAAEQSRPAEQSQAAVIPTVTN